MCSESEPAADTTSQQTNATENKTQLTFHESWSEQQRADLLRMYCMLLIDVPTAMDDFPALVEAMEDMVEAHVADNFRDWDEAEFERLYREASKKCSPKYWLFMQRAVSPWLELLKETAATGRGDVYGKDGSSLAWLAVRLGMPDMVKELVRRGTDPNHPYCVSNGGLGEIASMEVQEDLLTAVVAQDPLCVSAEISPQTSKELLDWLLANGADPNKSHAPTLLLCCSKEMFWNRSVLCSEPILLLLESLPPVQQRMLINHLLQAVPDNGALLEKLHNKGLLQLQDMHLYGNILSDLKDAELTPDIPQKMQLLLNLGVDPNAMPEILEQDDFESEDAFDAYTDQFCSYPPLHPLRSIFYLLLDNEDGNVDMPLQCLEMLLKAGATTDIYESELPDNPQLREKIVALMHQYNVPILPEEREEFEEHELEDDEEEPEEEYNE